MAPAADKREAILEYLKTTALPRVVAGDDYNLTIKTIERGRRNENEMTDGEFPVVFIPGTSERRKNRNPTESDSRMDVVLVGFVKSSAFSPNSSATGVQKDLGKLIRDVTKALEQDPLMGGLITWMEIQEVTSDDGDTAPIAGFVMTVAVNYTFTRKSP